MSIRQHLCREVARRAPFHDANEHFHAEQPPLRLHCDLAGAETFGCAVRELRLCEDTGPPLSVDELARRAAALCAKVTYLLEPLALIEVDGRTRQVLIRSQRPRQEDDGLSYYELVTGADHSATLRRIHYDPVSGYRPAVPFLLSTDQFGLLIDDFVGTLAPFRAAG